MVKDLVHVPQPQPQPQPNDEDSRNSRIMSLFKDSLLSQDPTLSPSIHSSFIQLRLQQLFNHSFHTPTHPPYALMIRRAIMELNEGTGSTEEAISEFVRREYEDLPWAHVKILGLHLRKLCQVGELACNEAGRYVLLLENADGGERERCKGEKKRKREKRKRNNRGDGERKGTIVERCEGVVVEVREQIQVCGGEQACDYYSIERVEEDGTECEKGWLQVVPKQSQCTEVEAPAPNELQVPQIEDSIPHSETVCSSQPTAFNLPVDSQQSLLVSISEGLPKCISQAEIGSSLTQMQPQMSCHGPSESSLDAAAAKMTASLSSLNVQEHKQDESPMSGDPEQQHPNHQCGLMPHKSKLVEDYQGESLLPSGEAIVIEEKPNVKQVEKWSNQTETFSASQPAAHNFPVNLTQNFEQQLVVPTSEGSPECIISTGNELSSPTQMQQQISSDIDLGLVSQTKASLTCVNVDADKQPQHYNQGSSNGNLNENPMSEQKPPKRPRGRPPKSETVANHTGESLLPSDDGMHNKQKPNINNLEKKHRCGRGRGRGRPRNANQREEQLRQDDQVQQHGPRRGRGRPRKMNQNTKQCGEQLQQEYQAKQHGRGRGRGRGRPPKLNRNTNQCEEQLQPQDQAQGLVSFPNSGGTITEPPAAKATSL